MTPRALPAVRVLVDSEPQSGVWNMAVDELLLEAAVNEERCSLRWYRWNRPTVSLGYFQTLSAIRRHAHLSGLPVVRRLSGGGAIVHDHELTYSCALAASHPCAQRPRELYARIHERMIEVLAEFGVAAHLRGDDEARRNNEFLCFDRGDSFDVVVGADKVLGSAQRRRKGAILQHGSLVLQRSLDAPQFPGILDLAVGDVDVEGLSQRLVERVGGLLSDEPILESLSPAELQAARSLATGHYGDVQ